MDWFNLIEGKVTDEELIMDAVKKQLKSIDSRKKVRIAPVKKDSILFTLEKRYTVLLERLRKGEKLK